MYIIYYKTNVAKSTRFCSDNFNGIYFRTIIACSLIEIDSNCICFEVYLSRFTFEQSLECLFSLVLNNGRKLIDVETNREWRTQGG